MRALHARVAEELGNPDIFYSNAAMAGIMPGIKTKIEDASLEEFEICWRAIAGGAFLVSGTLLPKGDQGSEVLSRNSTVSSAALPSFLTLPYGTAQDS